MDGGQSAFSHFHGLAVDSTFSSVDGQRSGHHDALLTTMKDSLKVTLVTGDDNYKIITAYTNSDYFYALSRGRGSARGISYLKNGDRKEKDKPDDFSYLQVITSVTNQTLPESILHAGRTGTNVHQRPSNFSPGYPWRATNSTQHHLRQLYRPWHHDWW